MKCKIGQTLRWEIFARDGFTCRYCGMGPTTHPGTFLEVDHIKPRSKEGTDDPSNLLTACGTCNNGKRDKIIPPLGHAERTPFVPRIHPVPLIKVFVRHSAGCRYKADESSKKCDCPKHLRWTHQGKQHRRTAKTRSWATAEETRRKVEVQYALLPGATSI